MLILASTSPRRKELMEKYYKDFEIISPTIDETTLKILKNIKKYSLSLSKAKALDVFCDHKNDVVIGCDTIVVYKNKIFGKPINEEDARKMLETLSGKTHYVLSSYTIISNSKTISKCVKSYVKFNKISESDLNEYLKLDIYKDKAGSYAIQNDPYHFVKKIKGSYTNIVGFPIEKIIKNLAKLNYFPNKES